MAVPTNPKDLKAIKEAIKEISTAMTMIEDRRSYINDVKKEIKENYELEATTVSTMIKAYHKNNLEELQEQLDDCESVFNA